MKQPLWKRWLSYLTEIHIESAPGEINPHLYISLKNGRYQLSTANAIYSYDDLYDNFFEVFKKINWASTQIQKVLILGYGTGSIPYMLEKNWGFNFEYTAIEKDENVLYLANKYTQDQIQSKIVFICADALHYVNQSNEQFDLICMDIFLDDKIPPQFKTRDYLTKLSQQLKAQGILLYNTLASLEQDIAEAEAFYKDEFQAVFPHSEKLEVGENFILVNDKSCLIK